MMDKKHLLEFLLIHADTGNIIGHRLGEWCGHGPVLEQDLAMTNFALDHLGRARLLYQYAGEIDGNSKTEDDLAFLRFEYEYKNLLLAEFANTDFAFTVARQFFLDSYYMDLLEGLTNSTDQRIAQIATKSLKETSYHYKWSSEWLIRLGDGTEISHAKMQFGNLQESFLYQLNQKLFWQMKELSHHLSYSSLNGRGGWRRFFPKQPFLFQTENINKVVARQDIIRKNLVIYLQICSICSELFQD